MHAHVYGKKDCYLVLTLLYSECICNLPLSHGVSTTEFEDGFWKIAYLHVNQKWIDCIEKCILKPKV